jgi:hypothetical protein
VRTNSFLQLRSISLNPPVNRKASAKAREFEKGCGQNEGDNSAPRMLKIGQQSCPSKQRCETSG